MSAEALDRSAPADAPRDWPAQAADTIVDVVDKVRTQTTAKAVVAARGVVFGVVIGILGLIGIIAFTVGLIRLVHVGLAAGADLFGYDMSEAQAVYLSYLIVGAVFVVVGGVLWRMANRRAVSAAAAAAAEEAA